MSTVEIMQSVAEGKLTAEQAAALLTPKRRKAEIKIGNKKNIVVKLGSQMRYPTTLYANQWQELSEVMPEILKFIEANKNQLSFKDELEAA